MGFPLIFDSIETNYTSQGNGALSDAISCLVTENLNGSYELEMKYPATGLHAEYIIPDNIIVCQANLNALRQAFRIYEVKQEINGIATIYARHISYDLNGYPVEPFTAASLTEALEGLLGNAQFPAPFSIDADFTSSADFSVSVPSPIRSWFGGREGSLIDIYGGEWEYDNFSCHLRQKRGQDNNVRVQYSKNMSKYTKDVKSDSLYSHVCAYWHDEETDTTVQGDYVPTGITQVTRIKFLDTSTEYEEAPTAATLTAYAQGKAPAYNSAAVNVSVEVIPMNDIQDLIELGDTVHVYYQNDIFTTRCVTVVWNVLKEMYDSISVGALKTSLAATINSSVAQDGYATKKDVASMIQKNAAAKIVGVGEENGWRYKKYSDGTFEAHQQIALNGVAATTAYGSLYRSAAYSFGNRPSFDTSSQLIINVTFHSTGSYTGWALCWGAASSTTIGTWVIVRNGSASSVTGKLNASIYGTWTP